MIPFSQIIINYGYDILNMVLVIVSILVALTCSALVWGMVLYSRKLVTAGKLHTADNLNRAMAVFAAFTFMTYLGIIVALSLALT